MFRMKKNIAVMGMKHSGKSTVGKLLAQKHRADFFDIDEIIIKLNGTKQDTIRDIYNRVGKEEFMTFEIEAASYILKQVPSSHRFIVSFGGGAVDNYAMYAMFSEHCIYVCLQESADVLYERIMRNGLPPFFTSTDSSKKEFTEMYNKRSGKYLQTADVVVSLQGCDIQTAVQRTEYSLKEHGYAW